MSAMIADQIAAMLDHDGTAWTTTYGETLHSLSVSHGAAYLHFGREQGGPAVVYAFPDASKIVTRESGWDLGYPGTGFDCLCWQSLGHVPGCPCGRE